MKKSHFEERTAPVEVIKPSSSSVIMQVPMNPAETLLNYIVHHTDLYMRRKKGVTDDALWHKAFKALSPWLKRYRAQVIRETAEEFCCSLCCAQLKHFSAELESYASMELDNLAATNAQGKLPKRAK